MTAPITSARVRELGEKATAGVLASAERVTLNEYVECPACNGEGEMSADDFCNFDGVALGVQFYGIGTHFGAQQALWEALCSEPARNRIADALALLERIEAGDAGLVESLCVSGVIAVGKAQNRTETYAREFWAAMQLEGAGDAARMFVAAVLAALAGGK